MNVLVTGVGGGIGQGIIKSLRMIENIKINVVAADISEFATGLYTADASYLVDKYDSDRYLESLSKIFIKESIDFYFPGTDVELIFCSKNKQLIMDTFGVHTVISSEAVINIAHDKYKTAMFLKENNFHYPKTIHLQDADEDNIVFPVIIKPCVGYGSNGVYKVNNLIELKAHLKNPQDILIQECIGDDNAEYTCTVVKVNGLLSPVLALKRILRAGDTYRATPEKSKKIEQYVSDVAKELDIDGGCNFQLRLDTNGNPKIFEINSRFSGTTPFCAQIGFNPVEFYLKKNLGLECDINIDYNSILLRYWSEAVVQKSSLKKLSDDGTLNPSEIQQFQLFQ